MKKITLFIVIACIIIIGGLGWSMWDKGIEYFTNMRFFPKFVIVLFATLILLFIFGFGNDTKNNFVGTKYNSIESIIENDLRSSKKVVNQDGLNLKKIRANADKLKIDTNLFKHKDDIKYAFSLPKY